MSGNVTSYQTNFVGLGSSQGGGAPSGVIPTPLESIEEIKVNVSNQTSDFNNSSGAQIQMATKRGTNQLHGSAYMVLFRYHHTASARIVERQPHAPDRIQRHRVRLFTSIVSNHRDRFGGALGGPLVPKNFPRRQVVCFRQL